MSRLSFDRRLILGWTMPAAILTRSHSMRCHQGWLGLPVKLRYGKIGTIAIYIFVRAACVSYCYDVIRRSNPASSNSEILLLGQAQAYRIELLRRWIKRAARKGGRQARVGYLKIVGVLVPHA